MAPTQMPKDEAKRCETKQCGACKDFLSVEGYSKKQWEADAATRRCRVCVDADAPNTAPKTPEEAAERDAFIAAAIAALETKGDVTNHTKITVAKRDAEDKGEKPPPAPPPRTLPPGPDPADVVRKLCFDFPDVRRPSGRVFGPGFAPAFKATPCPRLRK